MATKNLVTCKFCKDKIDRDLAYQVGARSFYCSEAEYLSYLKKQEEEKRKTKESKPKKKTKQETMDLISEVFEYEVTNTLLSNKLRELAKIYTYDSIYSYVYENFDHLNKILNGRTFNNERSKIRYFLAIIKNEVVDYLSVKKTEIENKDYIDDIEYEILEVKYKNKNKRRSLYDIEMELEEDE